VKIRFLITNAYGVGGTIRTTYNVAGELAKRHDVEIVSVHKNRDVPAFPVPRGVTLRHLSDRSRSARARDRRARGPRRLRVWARGLLRLTPSVLIHRADFRYKRFSLESDIKLWRFIRSVEDGVLIGTRAGLNLAIARLAHPGVVAVGQEHLNYTKYKPSLRKAFAELYPRLEAYSTLTERDAEAFRQHLGSGEANVVCIPNGIPGVEGPRSSNSSRIVLAAGRLTRQKGFDRLIPAWAQVQAKHPDWELRIFGSGKLRPELEALIAKHGVGETARLMGYTDRLPEEMAKAAFYVMSSRFEGFPMVLLEAMATGLPVVSFDCPNGPADLVTRGKDGFVVPNGKVKSLAGAMIRMIELGHDVRHAFGEAAYEKAKQYRVDAVALRWEELLQELLDAHADGQRRAARRRGIHRIVRSGSSA
jgi:glycosyltransferase involved in cell wall biosynthesis